MKLNRVLRRRLIQTTILTAMPFMSYGGQALANCVATPPGPPTHVCSGVTTATQAIDFDDADVVTSAGFSLNTATGNGIAITGSGALKFTDDNKSAIVAADDGLSIESAGATGSIDVRTNGDITGENRGIYARNEGDGDLVVAIDGDVTGITEEGVHVSSDFGSAGGLTLTIGAASVITGGTDGIYAVGGGEGDLAVTIKGTVIGRGGHGLEAYTDLVSGNMAITTERGSSVTGREDGINAGNNSGDLEIVIKDKVVGETDDGLEARTSKYGSGLRIITETGSVVAGADNGIEVFHAGDGDLLVGVNGEAKGGRHGIDLDVQNLGESGISVGSGGLVQGGQSAIFFTSNAAQSVSIANAGVIRNISGSAEDMAILAAQQVPGVVDIGDVTITNNGSLIGRVGLSDGDDRLTNNALWDTRGNNEFGDGTDEIVNAGTLIAAGDGEFTEGTFLLGVEYFRNSGLITMVDGGAGDDLILSADYESESGTLAVDAVLAAGPLGQADKFIIDGNVIVGGVTKVAVNVVDVVGANTEGIMVINPEGTTDAGDFVLKDGPINAGFFTWDMRFDLANHWHEIYTSGIGVGAYELAAGITGAQDIWHQTTGTLAQRQADLRPLLNGQQVTPVADFAQPLEPSPLGRVGPGFWMTGIGAWLERDAEQDGFTLDRKQSIYGGLAGFDFAAEGAGDAWLFGIFAGYVGSTLKFNDTNTQWTYDGPSVGAYATYLNDAFYADLTVKVDFLSISIDPEDMAQAADDSDTDAVNLGGRIDTGYKFGGAGGVFIEPQATLSVINTDIDDTDIYGGTADFEDETSIKGRLGLRLGFDHTAGNAVVYSSDVTASVWHEFNDSNSVSIATPDVPSFTVSDDMVPTVGDISLGFGIVSPEGWSAFLRGNYQFAEDYDAITGNAGVRYAW